MTSQDTSPPRLPLIGDKAPGFTADSTHGPVRLADYAGRWLVLFSHPADFTPVCTTEFVAFAELADRFAATRRGPARQLRRLGAQPPGLGPRHPREARRHHPLPDHRRPGHPGCPAPTACSTPGHVRHRAVRAVFVIDPERSVRAILYYPMNAGRIVPEILRLVDALQTSDRDGVACPANWRPGDDVVLPAPRTQAELDARLADDTVKLTDWYLATVPAGPAAS